MSTLTRTYHGCQIISTPAESEIEGGDGWTHRLSRDGADLGEFQTLAAAIAEARRVNAGEPPMYTPLASQLKPIREQAAETQGD